MWPYRVVYHPVPPMNLLTSRYHPVPPGCGFFSLPFKKKITGNRAHGRIHHPMPPINGFPPPQKTKKEETSQTGLPPSASGHDSNDHHQGSQQVGSHRYHHHLLRPSGVAISTHCQRVSEVFRDFLRSSETIYQRFQSQAQKPSGSFCHEPPFCERFWPMLLAFLAKSGDAIGDFP